MNHPQRSQSQVSLKHLRDLLVLYTPLWLGAAIGFGALGATYSLLRTDHYLARQPLVVRDEANSAVDRMGRFASASALRAAQETVLDIAHNRTVVAAAMCEIGPPNENAPADWPTVTDVDDAIEQSVNVIAPQGEEFGGTEVIYLQTKAESQQRAIDLCNAMFKNLTNHLRKVRQVRADSVIEELSYTRDLAQEKLDKVAAEMQKMESLLGEDLGDLRNLNDAISGDSATRRALENARLKMQNEEVRLRKMQSLLDLLVQGAKDPDQLLINGDDLLRSQPSLQRLKEGLIDAQLQASKLVGVYTAENPKRKAAEATEREIRHRIVQETQSVINAMQPALDVQTAETKELADQVRTMTQKLAVLAEARTTYADIDADLRNRQQQLANAEQRLSEAEANRKAALSTSLVASLGDPIGTDKPVGPGGTSITIGSVVAGLLFGLGTVFLVAPGQTNAQGGRRWSDRLMSDQGRSGDRKDMRSLTGRRASDRPVSNLEQALAQDRPQSDQRTGSQSEQNRS